MLTYDIRLVAGCPGSGKTTYLNQLRSEGELDIVLADGLDSPKTWPRAFEVILADQKAGKRIGICGQTITSIETRAKITEGLGGQVIYEFFEPAYGACIKNIILDTLAGRPYGFDRACCVDAIWRRGLFQLPSGIKTLPVHKSEVSSDEIDHFFGLIKLQPPGEQRIRRLIAEF